MVFLAGCSTSEVTCPMWKLQVPHVETAGSIENAEEVITKKKEREGCRKTLAGPDGGARSRISTQVNFFVFRWNPGSCRKRNFDRNSAEFRYFRTEREFEFKKRNSDVYRRNFGDFSRNLVSRWRNSLFVNRKILFWEGITEKIENFDMLRISQFRVHIICFTHNISNTKPYKHVHIASTTLQRC